MHASLLTVSIETVSWDWFPFRWTYIRVDYRFTHKLRKYHRITIIWTSYGLTPRSLGAFPRGQRYLIFLWMTATHPSTWWKFKQYPVGLMWILIASGSNRVCQDVTYHKDGYFCVSDFVGVSTPQFACLLTAVKVEKHTLALLELLVPTDPNNGL